MTKSIYRTSMLLTLLCLAGMPSPSYSQETVTLAISDLVAQGVKESDAAVVSEQLRVEIARHPQIRLVERGQMQEILKEQGFQQSGCTDDACAVEVGQLLGVKNIVVGSVGSAGSFTLLTLRVIDVTTGAITFSESIRTKGGINQVIDKGIGEATILLHRSLFASEGSANTASSKRASRPRRAVLIGGAGAALLGGAIAAVVITSRPDKPPPAPDTYTEIYLP